MTRSPLRRDLLRAGAAAAASCALPRARACEFFTTTLRIEHPWTRASMDASSPAIVCMKFDSVTRDDRLVGVVTPVAERAVLAGNGLGPELDLPIPAGVDTLLTEEGVHVRLLGLLQPLQIGRAFPLTLRFEKGGEVAALLNVAMMPVARG